ncbi:hypothetical protein [Candidatus Uabimicrobium amorphum]|uniref:Lipoprotein signal peptidase n=1 Tax=Uabimicrobium amorphum TaxID=2596890 RepID=A0A5S9IJI7_UABAM|nr:hypothetical protein [Candidatus Uabimicrobium amorphum]BBM83039.1 lipoprotein signal peptidase [Candidatus Uabimicrobium amorphum]
MADKRHTVTVKIDKNNNITLKNLPFSPGDEVEVIVRPINIKAPDTDDSSEETFISGAKSFSESLVIETPELDDDDFATFMGEVKSPEVDKHSKSFIGRLTSRYRSDQIKKKSPKKPKPPKIPKNKILNKADKITNRSVSKKILLYFHTALRVILDHKKINLSKESASHKLPTKFLVPNDNCEMVFGSEKEAQKKNGIRCNIQINKQVLEMQGRKIITRFIEHYEDRPYFFLGEVDPVIFSEICSIMEKRQSKWKGIFRFPYRLDKGKKEALLDILQQRKSRIKKEKSRQVVSEVIEYYEKNPDADFHFRDVAKVERFLTDREKDKVFIDMRKNLKVEAILPILQKILGKMKTPYYNVLVTGELLSSQSTSFYHRPASFGIVKIDEDKIHHFKHKKIRPCLTDNEFSKKLHKVLTGKVMYEEAQLNKHSGGQRKELEDLLIPSQEIKKVKKLPDYDKKIKQTSFLHLFSALCAMVLAFLPYTGVFWAQQIPELNEYSTRYISAFLGVIAIWNTTVAFSLFNRRGRFLSIMLNIVLVMIFGFFMFTTTDRNTYLLYIPWILLSLWMAMRLLRPIMQYYFDKDFGPIYAKFSFANVLVLLLIIAVIITCNLAFYYPQQFFISDILKWPM